MGMYGDEIFCNEGYLIHSKESKEFRNQIINAIKDVNGSFIDRIKNIPKNLGKSKPSDSDISKVTSAISRASDYSYISDIIIESRTYSDSYTTVHYEVYTKRFFCIKGNSIISGYVELYGSGISYPSITDAALDKQTDFTIDDFKNAIDMANKFSRRLTITFGVYLGKNKIKFKNTGARGNLDTKDMYQNLINSPYANKYNFKIHPLMNYITVTKK